MNTVTVYTTGPGCQLCKLTKETLTRRGVPFVEVDIRERPTARELVVDELGYAEAPVVVVDEHDHWSGFRPDHIDRIARSWTTLIDLWLEAAHEAYALRAQLAHLEEAWLRAEADADFWYFKACNRSLPEAPG